MGVLEQLLRAAGISPAAGQQLAQSVHAAACYVRDLTRALELEHGHTTGELTPHNPAQVPAFLFRDLEADTAQTVDVEGALGKFCTRGHVANVGDTELLVAFQGVAGDQWSDEYHLPAGAALDTSSFAYRKARVTAVDIAGRAQIMAQ